MSAIADTVESLFGTKVQRSLETVAQSEEDLKADPNNTWKKYRVVFTKGVGMCPLSRRISKRAAMRA
jgi:hypothetical protein